MTILVLLPGLDGTGELFAPFVDALKRIDTRVVAYPPDRAMTYAQHEAFVRDKLPRGEDYVILAESFSGPVGIAIAASAPPNLKGLILCCSFAANPLPLFGPLARIFGRLPALRVAPALAAPWLYARRGTPGLRRAHGQAMSRVAPIALRARVAAVLAVDYRPLLLRIEVPTLYLRAKADRLIPRAAGRAITERRPDVELVEIDGPHFLLQTEPIACAQAVERFMEHDVTPDPPLDVEQSLRVSKLTQDDLLEMDRVLVAQASTGWRKVARIVAGAIDALSARLPDVP
ncbi:MAG TPA: alpha/beta hydrolase, partial [Steroidobacteraceae bacterium]|nr:alpha/beta hydrolase [Steroidobacteraceae bacterium]